MKTPASPRSFGFTMPAEWEQQFALWLTWPTNPKWWSGRIDEIALTYRALVSAAARFQHVNIICPRDAQAQVTGHLKETDTDMTRIRFFDIPTNDVWLRDNGPIFIRNPNTRESALTDWEFNAWGEKFPDYDLDNRVPLAISQALGIKRFRYALCMEGGGIESNGRGTAMATKSVFLNEKRNYDVSLEEYQRVLYHALALNQIIWLEDGLANDDTDGHIDNVARFASPSHVVIATVNDPKHPSFHSLLRNKNELSGTLVRGQLLKVTELPLPDPFPTLEEARPASYVNYVVLNGAVLVPQFNQPEKDAQAIKILRGAFPKREIIGIDCRLMVEEGGGLHCCTCNAF